MFARFSMGGFYPVPFQRMNATKTTPARRRLLALAYTQPDPKRWRHPQEPLPGILYDATVFGLFLFLGVAYFM